MEEEISRIEDLIERRANRKFEESTKIVKVDRKKMLENLKAAKQDIKDEQKKAEDLWKQAIEAYYEYMKKHMASKQIGNPPDKPRLPEEYDTIDGYTHLFESLTDDKLNLEIDFLEKIYLKTAKGITEAKQSTAYMAAFCSGSAFGVSDFSLNTTGVYNYKEE